MTRTVLVALVALATRSGSVDVALNELVGLYGDANPRHPHERRELLSPSLPLAQDAIVEVTVSGEHLGSARDCAALIGARLLLPKKGYLGEGASVDPATEFTVVLVLRPPPEPPPGTYWNRIPHPGPRPSIALSVASACSGGGVLFPAPEVRVDDVRATISPPRREPAA